MSSDRLDQIRPEGHRLVVQRQNDIAGLDAGAIGRLARIHARHERMDVGQHADLADFEAALFRRHRRRHGTRQRLTAAQQFHRDFAVRPRANRDEELLPGVDAVIGDRHDAVAGPDVGFRRRRVRHHDADDRRLILVRRDFGALIQHDRREDQREHDVHRRSHDEHLEPFPLALRQELVRSPHDLTVRVALDILGRVAGHLHVAAERERADAVFGIASLEAEDCRIEAELKLRHADADAFRGQKVSELVHEHEHPEHECKSEQRRHSFNSTVPATS